MSTSFKEMLRNRCPAVVDFALKWCKAKQRWIEHVYENSIRIYKTKADKNEACRIVLGISKKHRGFNFHYSITWDNLTKEEVEYWNSIEKWVKWFQSNMTGICQDIEIHNEAEELNNIIIEKYLYSLKPANNASLEEKENRMDYIYKFIDYLIVCAKELN